MTADKSEIKSELEAHFGKVFLAETSQPEDDHIDKVHVGSLGEDQPVITDEHNTLQTKAITDKELSIAISRLNPISWG